MIFRVVSRRDVVGVPGSVPVVVKDFNLYSGTGCVFFACVLSYVTSGGGPDILVTTDSVRPAFVLLYSVLVHSLWLS